MGRLARMYKKVRVEMSIEVNWVYRAQLDRVIDGDTVVLVVDNGFHNREHHSFRLRGVDAPEIFTKDAEEKRKGYLIKAVVEEWFLNVNGCSSEEWNLVIKTEKDKRTFNRYIADILCEKCSSSLNAAVDKACKAL